jgi:hypothetical protein
MIIITFFLILTTMGMGGVEWEIMALHVASNSDVFPRVPVRSKRVGRGLGAEVQEGKDTRGISVLEGSPEKNKKEEPNQSDPVQTASSAPDTVSDD